ncbi:MAG: beta-propeller fold lactonase family protein [Candidatus Acidiferrales bacterium]
MPSSRTIVAESRGTQVSLGKLVGWVSAFIAVVLAVALLFSSARKIPRNVAYVSEEEGGISVINLDTLQVEKRIHLENFSPRGIGITFDGKRLITANKNTADASVFDTRGLRLIRRIKVGENPEFVKLHPSGKWLFTSFEPGSSGGPPGQGTEATGEKDEDNQPSQIIAFNVKDWSRERAFTAGTETEGIEFSRDGRLIVVANEAQNTIGIFEIETGKRIREIELAPYGIRPRGIKISPGGNSYAVTLEASGTLLLLDENFNVTRSISTGAKPYGVAFDREGRRIFVAAAAARKLQIFSADSFQLLGEADTGQRCWHFTFTPDDSKILLACGRSNDVHVIDAKTYRPIRAIGGFHLPWGIVAFPRAFGSLGLP